MTNFTHMSRRDSRVNHTCSHGVSHGHVTESRSRSRKEQAASPPPATRAQAKRSANSAANRRAAGSSRGLKREGKIQ